MSDCGVRITAFDGNHKRFVWQEHAADFNRLVHQAARILANVDDETGDLLFRQSPQGLLEFLRGVADEFMEGEISDGGAWQDVDIVHTVDRDFRPHQLDGDFLVLVRTMEGHGDRGPLFAAQPRHDFVRGLAVHALAIHGDDLVVGQHSRAGGGGALDGVDHRDPAVLHRNLESDTGKGIGLEVFAEFLRDLRRHVFRVGVQFRRQADNRVVQQPIRSDRLLIDIILTQKLHDFNEEVEPVQHLVGIAGFCLFAVSVIAPDEIRQEQCGQKTEEDSPEFHAEG